MQILLVLGKATDRYDVITKFVVNSAIATDAGLEMIAPRGGDEAH